MPTPHYLRLLVLAPALVSTAFAANTLTGKQTETTVTLAKGNYALEGRYTVPAGMKLELTPGVVITASKNSSLVVDGQLIVSGDEKNPVIFRGTKSDGIKVGDTGKATVSGLQVTGADVGLEVGGSIDKLTASVFFKNVKGVKLNGKGNVVIDNCLFSENTADGLRFTGVHGTISNCTFVKNKGFGVTVGESNPKFDHCLFSDNAGAGIEQSNASSATSMSGTQCSFDGKTPAFLSSMSHGSLEFTKCYWGDKGTTLLKAKGDKAVLPLVKDARNGGGSLKIYWADFLTAAPKPCGATVVSKL